MSKHGDIIDGIVQRAIHDIQKMKEEEEWNSKFPQLKPKALERREEVVQDLAFCKCCEKYRPAGQVYGDGAFCAVCDSDDD